MKWTAIPGAIALLCCFGAAAAAGHDCAHDGHHGTCWECDHQVLPANRPSQGSGLSGATANLQALEGRIVEVVYLPGATADSGMVEIRVQSGGQATLVRLAPSGFLKRGGVLLREGDTVVVKGFSVAGMEGDLIVATEIQRGDKRLSLRDTRGRTAW
jgi:hypothetical protein